jgi:hypothetical protein
MTMNKFKSMLFIPTLLLLTIGFSQVTQSAGLSPSKEDREAMAQAHEKMAACLRSNKSVDECHEEMRSACMKFGYGCGMGPGMNGAKRGGRRGMGPRGAAPSTNAPAPQASPNQPK